MSLIAVSFFLTVKCFPSAFLNSKLIPPFYQLATALFSLGDQPPGARDEIVKGMVSNDASPQPSPIIN